MFASEGTFAGVEIWLNADILQGPTGKPSEFNPDEFIDICRDFIPTAKLSLGYTSGSLPFWEGKYAKPMIDRMLALCSKYSLQNVTFTLNAAIAKNSEEVKRLVIPSEGNDEVKQFTLTLWGEADSHVKKWITSSLDPKRTFVDIQTPNSTMLFSMKKGIQGVLSKRPWSMTILDDGSQDEEEDAEVQDLQGDGEADAAPAGSALLEKQTTTEVEGGENIQ